MRRRALQVRARQVLAETLIHSLRGLDEEGVAHLHEADRLAAESGDRASAAQARAELGYVDFLRARYDRAELWLTDALGLADGSPSGWPRPRPTWVRSTATRGNYPRATALLDAGAAALARTPASRAARPTRCP